MDMFINWFLNTFIRVEQTTKQIIIIGALVVALLCISKIVEIYGKDKKKGFPWGYLILMILSGCVVFIYSTI